MDHERYLKKLSVYFRNSMIVIDNGSGLEKILICVT